jgi:hypothetical protein
MLTEGCLCGGVTYEADASAERMAAERTVQPKQQVAEKPEGRT